MCKSEKHRDPYIDSYPPELRERVLSGYFENTDVDKLTREERYIYERRLKDYRDWYSTIQTYYLKGMAKGEAERIEKIIRREKLEAARRLKAAGCGSDMIARYIGLSAEEIEKAVE